MDQRLKDRLLGEQPPSLFAAHEAVDTINRLERELEKLRITAILDGKGGFVDGCVHSEEYLRVHSENRKNLLKLDEINNYVTKKIDGLRLNFEAGESRKPLLAAFNKIFEIVNDVVPECVWTRITQDAPADNDPRRCKTGCGYKVPSDVPWDCSVGWSFCPYCGKPIKLNKG